MSVPTLSVIVPIYNSASTLRGCVDSILSQDFEDFELILVDDGSTDASPQIGSEYQRRDSRIRYLWKENGGLSSARNAGLKVAEGAYVSFVDSDDEIAGDFYRSAFRDEGHRGFDIFLTGMDRFSGEVRFPDVTRRDISEDEFLELFLTTNYVGLSVCNKIFNRQIIFDKELEFRDVRFAEDLVFVSEYLPWARHYVFDNRALYSYKEHPESMTNKARTTKVLEERDFEILEALELAAPVYQNHANPFAGSCFRVRLARSSLRLWLLMWMTRTYREDALARVHQNMRMGVRDFLSARYQKVGLKLIMLFVVSLPSMVTNNVLALLSSRHSRALRS